MYNMNYYIFKHDWDFDLLKSEEPFDPYSGKPINFGRELLDNFPKITLSFKSKQLPDSIPNFNGYIVFNQKIISELKEAGVDYIQYFDVDVENKAGEVVSDDYKCLNILKVVDAIDFENSNLKWTDLEKGETEEDRSILGVLDLRLNYSAIDNLPLFRLKGLETFLVFREDVAENIVNKGYEGLAFYPAEGYYS